MADLGKRTLATATIQLYLSDSEGDAPLDDDSENWHRTGEENFQIAEWQKRFGRNPFFADNNIKRIAKRAIIKGMKAELVGKKGSRGALKNALENAANEIFNHVYQRFESGMTPGQELSPRYLYWKGKNYPGRPKMVASGGLLRSIKQRVSLKLAGE